MLTGYSPRAANLTVYVMSGFAQYKPLLAKLGPHKTGASCLYLKSLDDIDLKVLERIIVAGIRDMGKRYTTRR